MRFIWLMDWLCVRRIRELNENNTKKFIEERKRQAVLQSRQMELLHKLHQDQADKLRTEMNSVWIHRLNNLFPFYDSY